MERNNKYQIIFLFDTPALQTDIKKFGLDRLIKLTNNITVCDISQTVNPDINRCVTAQRMKSDDFSVVTLSSFAEIREFIRSGRKNSFFFPMFDDYYAVRFIYYCFSLYHVKYGYINNLNPDINDVGIPRINMTVEKIKFDKIRKGFYNRVIRKINCICPAKLYFYSNELSKEHYFWRGNCSKKTKMIGVHTFDFDRYLATKPFKYDVPYAVYLDVFLPYHPDCLNMKISIDAEKYFKNMNLIFDEIEKVTGCRVLIAAHPRSNYADKPYAFDLNNIYYGITAELVKGAKFLIGSWSTTNRMAVIENKPLIIVCEEEAWNDEYCRKQCEAQAAFLGTKVLRSKEDVDNTEITADEETYSLIRKRYMSVDNASAPDLWTRIINQVDSVMLA